MMYLCFRSVSVSGLKLPLKNSTQCTSDVWKNVACALHVKPCTAKVQRFFFLSSFLSFLSLLFCYCMVKRYVGYFRATAVCFARKTV